MTGTPEGSTESGFMEKPGIEPATPGLQGIALIHYTTGLTKIIGTKSASLVDTLTKSFITYYLQRYLGYFDQTLDCVCACIYMYCSTVAPSGLWH